MLDKLATFVATGGYVGFVPVAPGTFGSALGLAIYLVVRLIDNAFAEAAVIVATLALGTWASHRLERELGKDPGAVVIDEVLGMLVTVAFLDVTVAGALVGFVLFRMFDVWKPFPAAQLEHLHGGPGVMLDDAVAGVYSNLVMRLLIAVWPSVFA